MGVLAASASSDIARLGIVSYSRVGRVGLAWEKVRTGANGRSVGLATATASLRRALNAFTVPLFCRMRRHLRGCKISLFHHSYKEEDGVVVARNPFLRVTVDATKANRRVESNRRVLMLGRASRRTSRLPQGQSR